MLYRYTLRAFAISGLVVVLAVGLVRSAGAQTTIPLTADSWTATNGLRFESYLGRPSLFIDRGIALARGVDLRDGTIDLDMATPTGGNFMGAVFHASSTDNSEVVYFRAASSGTLDAMQYAPALNGVGAAWQIYHGDGANAAPELAFGRWYHVKIDVAGSVAKIYLNGEREPALVVPRLAGVAGSSLGVWTGAYGRGAYYSNITYTPRAPSAPAPSAALPRGTIADWDLSDAFDATAFKPGTAPSLAGITWEKVHVEAPGFVLVNRYRRAPAINIPRDPATGLPLTDRIMGGPIAGAKVVLARTVIQSDRDEVRRMLIGYTNGVEVYANGKPLFFGMYPIVQAGLGYMDMIGDGVFVPLKKGPNEVVLAVTDLTGGWGFWARLDP
ncbi:MAG TPA: hypothetical protein VGU66_01840 [Candidatus Elarobacter sp.]|nr:hypothetical protein [Candidatus Elarobacter sp.]